MTYLPAPCSILGRWAVFTVLVTFSEAFCISGDLCGMAPVANTGRGGVTGFWNAAAFRNADVVFPPLDRMIMMDAALFSRCVK